MLLPNEDAATLRDEILRYLRRDLELDAHPAAVVGGDLGDIPAIDVQTAKGRITVVVSRPIPAEAPPNGIRDCTPEEEAESERGQGERGDW